MILIVFLAVVAPPLAGYIGFLVGDKCGWFRGTAELRDSLINTLEKPQYFTGVNVLYLLRRMKGEKL